MGSGKTAEKSRGVKVRQKEIDSIVRFHRNLFREMRKVYEVPTRQSIKDKLRTLDQAKRILRNSEHFLCRDKEKFPPLPLGVFVQLTHEQHRKWCLNSAFKALDEAQGFLKSIPVGTGRPIAETIGGPGACACKLAEIFKKITGECCWKKVGEAIAKGFPEALQADDGSRDLRLWAYRLALRHRRALKQLEPGSTIPKLYSPLVWGLVENGNKV